MKKKRHSFGVACMVIPIILQMFLVSCQTINTKPVRNNTQKWRLAYYEAGPWKEYPTHLRALVDGLIELKWMEPLVLPIYENPDDTAQLWQFLAANTQSDFIEFLPDAYWSANWDAELRAQNQAEAIQRLSTNSDIDLIIAAGTWAGLDMANDKHNVPTFVISATNAISAGIITSAQDSGRDHVIAHVDPGRITRQINLFYDIVGFQTLGTIYEDTVDGRSYAHLQELEAFADKTEVKLLTCIAPHTNLPDEIIQQGTDACLEELGPQIDAFWLGSHRGLRAVLMPEVLEPLYGPWMAKAVIMYSMVSSSASPGLIWMHMVCGMQKLLQKF
ncbi:MAG: hypothetical protein K8R40_07875 [Anaerolineaceae bacterium]|nr:hypothetical protein [Anaerolineaceae bacterium]